LGSWRGLAGVPVLVLLLAIRTVFEERLLERNLSGYREYQQRVRYRFFPFVW
jgi:protein-S-isoprenylcysteine O-methyltransferase Ste14